MNNRISSIRSFIKKELIDRLMTVKTVGVDLGSEALKIVEVEKKEGQVRIRRCAVGKVENGNAAELLKKLFSETEIEAHQAALGLSSPEVVVKPFKCPPMPRKELASAIRIEAESAILNGHSLEEMAVDWQLLPSASKESLRGVLAVVPKTALAAPLQTARAAGLKPVVMDVEGLALWNAYWILIGSREPARKTALLINVGKGKTNLVIAKGPDELILVRDFGLGSKAIEAGQKKEWMEEVQDSLGYARSNGGLREVEAAYVTGGGAGSAVVSLLKPLVAVPVVLWNPFQQVKRGDQSAKVEESLGPLFTVAIGLALRRVS